MTGRGLLVTWWGPRSQQGAPGYTWSPLGPRAFLCPRLLLCTPSLSPLTSPNPAQLSHTDMHAQPGPRLARSLAAPSLTPLLPSALIARPPSPLPGGPKRQRSSWTLSWPAAPPWVSFHLAGLLNVGLLAPGSPLSRGPAKPPTCGVGPPGARGVLSKTGSASARNPTVVRLGAGSVWASVAARGRVGIVAEVSRVRA